MAKRSFSSVPKLGRYLFVFLLGGALAKGGGAEATPASRDRYAALDSFAKSLALISSSYVDGIEEQELIYGGIAGMVATLDPHSAFYTKAQYKRLRQDTEGEFGGVGILLREGAEGQPPEIESVFPGSPAAKAGLLPGDALVAVDGISTTNKHRSVQAWHSKLRGAAGSRVKVTIQRAQWEHPRDLVFVRSRVAIPSVKQERFGAVTYIAIRRFREATARDLRDALGKMRKSGSAKLILDLRGNPGGLLDVGIEVADMFLEEGVLVSVESRKGKRVETSRAHKSATFSGFPMVVLVDERSASASEIVAAALQDHGRATLIGQTTYGKGTVQTFMDLPDGSGLKLTTSRYFTPKGKSLDGQGITPDRSVDAFAPMIVTPRHEKQNQGGSAPRKELSSIQNERMQDDLQLSVSYQYLSPR